MQFLLGSLSTVVFFVCLYLAYRMGQRTKRPIVMKDEEAKRKAESVRSGFLQLMNYDVKTALSGKKVI